MKRTRALIGAFLLPLILSFGIAATRADAACNRLTVTAPGPRQVIDQCVAPGPSYAALNAGRVVRWHSNPLLLAGHYSTHGSVFRPLGGVGVGAIVTYGHCWWQVFAVSSGLPVGLPWGTWAAHYPVRGNLTLQHSISGTRVRQLHARAIHCAGR